MRSFWNPYLVPSERVRSDRATCAPLLTLVSSSSAGRLRVSIADCICMCFAFLPFYHRKQKYTPTPLAPLAFVRVAHCVQCHLQRSRKICTLEQALLSGERGVIGSASYCIDTNYALCVFWRRRCLRTLCVCCNDDGLDGQWV